MAEETRPEEAKAVTVEMTPEEFSAYERRLILEGPKDPESFQLLDGRTLAKAQAAQAAQDERDREAAREFEERSLRVNTPRVEKVIVTITPEGHFASPLVIAPAATATPPEEAAEVAPSVRDERRVIAPPIIAPTATPPVAPPAATPAVLSQPPTKEGTV